MNDKQWFEKENFWLNYGPIMFDAHHWAEAPGIARAICEMCQLTPVSTTFLAPNPMSRSSNPTMYASS